jgi:hypothetical protein
MEHYIHVGTNMAHYIYVFVPSWLIPYVCLFHRGTLCNNEKMEVGVCELL